MSKTALISVYSKNGIADFAHQLKEQGYDILASGGTAKTLAEAGVEVQDVASIVGGGAILGHRVVTLSREIHAGLLARDNDADRTELKKLGIPFIDLVCVDLYPLEEEIKNGAATAESVIEKTDIGGPTMLRSAAKGRRIVIADPADRGRVLEWLKAGEPGKEQFLNELAAKAEMIVARYAAISGEYWSGGGYQTMFGEKNIECAYGENAWQKPAALYRKFGGKDSDPLAIDKWQLVAGSPLSYNNICDLDRMLQTITHIGAAYEKNFSNVPHIALGAKHGNACGAAIAEVEIEAIDKMLLGDLRAIFGGSIMCNFLVDEKIAEELLHKFMPAEGKRLLDVIAAPSFSPEAVEILARKKGKCRLLQNEALVKAGLNSLDSAKRFRYVRGGFLTQPNYTFIPEVKDKDALLAFAVGATSNSNTITIVKNGRLMGNGVGQQDRVGAAKLAIFRADEAAAFSPIPGIEEKADLEGATAYSDSFFPFPDAPEVLIGRGIKKIFATSGSVNDDKIKETCAKGGAELILLPDREARGFYMH